MSEHNDRVSRMPEQQKIIDELEELLAMAKAGKLYGIVFVTQKDYEGETAVNWKVVGRVNAYAAMGGIEHAKQALLRSAEEQAW